MLVFTDGRERTAAEYRALLEASSFHLRRITPVAGGASVLEAVPMLTRSPARRPVRVAGYTRSACRYRGRALP
jgi:hypothetical protein